LVGALKYIEVKIFKFIFSKPKYYSLCKQPNPTQPMLLIMIRTYFSRVLAAMIDTAGSFMLVYELCYPCEETVLPFQNVFYLCYKRGQFRHVINPTYVL
jgi:hypothetical protein